MTTPEDSGRSNDPMTDKSLADRLAKAHFKRSVLDVHDTSGKRLASDTLVWWLYQHHRWIRTNGRFGAQMKWDDREHRSMTFRYANLDGIDFSQTVISNAEFVWCNLRLASFAGAELTNVRFENCDLEEVSFAGARFKNVRFKTCPDQKTANFKDVIRVALPTAGHRALEL